MNRLADETSPYLRQHADNPVDWYPWGEAAFEAARALDRPILLSVGYSSCHWCHVMAHESFEDDAIAARMNELFVNVKVDREERPDVDAIYMDAVQLLTGRGGWPMTVLLLPDGKPFFAGTYFRPDQFRSLLDRVEEAWHTERGGLGDQAEQLTEAIDRASELEPGDGLPTADVVERAVDLLRRAADTTHGGFGTAPKFPQTMNLEVLIRHLHRTGDPTIAEIVTTTLDAMASGGIHDQLGGGFARYSVDDRWIVPHFEKMLYDQALLLRAYLHGWQVVGRSEWRQVVEEIVAYVLGTLGLPGGGLASAEDADSEGEEGAFYVWTPEQLREVLGPDADAALQWWGVTDTGNFEGRSILVRAERGDLHRPPDIETARRRLLAARDERVRPGLDDKVLTEWNALFLSSLCEAAGAMGRDDWIGSAERIGDFLLTHLRRADGRWLRSWQAEAGTARHLATAADHAALIDAFTRLAELTGRRRWIDEALGTADALVELFHDDERGGVFTTGSDAEALITRPKDLADGATPSANSLGVVALLRLGALTGRSDLDEVARGALRLLTVPVAQQPTAFGRLLEGVELLTAGTTEVVVVGDVDGAVDAVRRRFEPGLVLAWGERYDSPLWAGRSAGRVYVCRDHACRLPVTDVDSMNAQLSDPGGDPSDA
ncbi:MAG: thioredoxin domain-containing protein [Actinomycetota bacterium]